MIKKNPSVFWFVIAIIVICCLYLLSSILLPFVVGMAIAYFLDPAVDRLENLGWNRSFSSIVVLVISIFILIFVLLLLAPVVGNQLKNFSQFLPLVLNKLQPVIENIAGLLNNKTDKEVVELPTGMFLKWSTRMLNGVLGGGVAFANLVSFMIITPVVAFYLLRDWDVMTAKVYGWLTLKYKDSIGEQFSEIDRRLAAFVRGQGAVCLILSVYYSIALTAADLEFGLVLGIFAGLISFVPFVGAIAGGLVSVGLAFLQFDTWTPVIIVLVVFFIGQILEGYFLTPKLIGEAVGLHPVWVIFALLAGGALFDFLGVLLALPLAAIVAVLFRFGLGNYLASSLYNNGEVASNGEKHKDRSSLDGSC